MEEQTPESKLSSLLMAKLSLCGLKIEAKLMPITNKSLKLSEQFLVRKTEKKISWRLYDKKILKIEDFFR